MVFVVTSVFSTTQTLCVGSHVARICRQVNRQDPKNHVWEHSPVRYLFKKIAHEFSDLLYKWCGDGVDLL
jgi:hypothetical protein